MGADGVLALTGRRSKPKNSGSPGKPAASGGDRPVERPTDAARGGGRTSARDGSGPDWRTLHLWQIQPLRDLLVLAAVFGVFYLGYVLRTVTIPILIAMALAYLFEPIVAVITDRTLLTRSKIAGGIIVLAGAVVVVPAVLCAAFAVGDGYAFWTGNDVRPGFGTRLSQLTKSIETTASPVDEPGDAGGGGFFSSASGVKRERTEAAKKALTEMPERWVAISDGIVGAKGVVYIRDLIGFVRSSLAQPLAHWTLGGFVATVKSVFSIAMLAFGVCLTAFFFYFFCTSYGALLSFWEGLIPERKKGRVIELAKQMDRVIAGFIRGRVLVGVFLAVFYALGYMIIGVPAPLVLGPVVGLLSIVPYVSLIGVPVSIVLLWLGEPGQGLYDSAWFTIVAPIGVYAIGQVLDDYVLSPIIQRRATDMDTPSIVFASLAGGLLAGVYGLLLAIPAAACVKILLREVFWPRFRAWAEGRERDFLPIGE